MIPRTFAQKTLALLLVVYAAASLVHFIHNAEFLPDYPGLPKTWTREGVYFVWVGMSAVGFAGWVLVLVEVARQLVQRFRLSRA